MFFIKLKILYNTWMIPYVRFSNFPLLSFLYLNKNNFNLINFFVLKKISFFSHSGVKFSKLNTRLNKNLFDFKTDVYFKSIKNVNNYFDQITPNLNIFLHEASQKPNNYFTFKKIITNENVFFYSFLNFFFSLNFSNYSSVFKNSKFSKLFFFTNKDGRLQIINTKKLLNRWFHSINFLYNLNYFCLKPLIMSLPYFRKQCLSLNWFFTKWDVIFWKTCFPFFLYKTNLYDKRTSYFFNKLKEDVSSFFIITDCMYHVKNLYYLRKNHFFTIGFVSLAGNPWIVNYPIIYMFESLSNQSFFFKIFSYSLKLANYHRFIFFKNNWNVIFKKILINLTY